MLPTLFDGKAVYPYASMLLTRSPLLKELYCESHRAEPWAISGDVRRVGHYVFPAVVAMDAAARTQLLETLRARVTGEPGYVALTLARVRAGERALVAATRRVRKGDHTAPALALLLQAAARVLSTGAFKEVLGPSDITAALATLMPVDDVRAQVLSLYQPRCLPHFMLYESRMLHVVARAGPRLSRHHVARAIARAAHVNRFLLEDNALHTPAVMRATLQELQERCGGAAGAARERRALHAGHARAVQVADAAEAWIHQVGARTRTTLLSRRLLLGITAMARAVGTVEESKHILVVEAARVLHAVMRARRLDVDSTDTARLLAAVR